LHPKYQGKLLCNNQVEEAKLWLKEKNPAYLQTVIAFEAKSSPFPGSYFDEDATNINPLTWWLSVSRRIKLPDGMLQLLKQLHTAIASSASIERVFSSYGLIQTKLRNKLGNEKAQKLVFATNY